jgi:hypothetical protein
MVIKPLLGMARGSRLGIVWGSRWWGHSNLAFGGFFFVDFFKPMPAVIERVQVRMTIERGGLDKDDKNFEGRLSLVINGSAGIGGLFRSNVEGSQYRFCKKSATIRSNQQAAP